MRQGAVTRWRAWTPTRFTPSSAPTAGAVRTTPTPWASLSSAWCWPARAEAFEDRWLLRSW